jgi:hypothetical protein
MVKIGWRREQVVSHAGYRGVERPMDTSLDINIKGDAENVIVYTIKVIFGYGATWSFYIAHDKVVDIKKDHGFGR